MRLNRFLAHCGVSSRRKCDEIIFSGQVKVNGITVNTPGFTVNPEKDSVTVGGKIIIPESKVYIALNKPANVLSTLKDDFGRKIITSLIENVKERIYPVGRLDYDVEGIILLTNDGELSNRLIHPRYKVVKTYIATVNGIFNDKKRKILEKGVEIDGKKTLPAKCRIIKSSLKESVIELKIREGRKRQVKNMFSEVGNPVKKLKRIKFGPVSLKNLESGKWRFLTKHEVRLLKKITDLT
jgi:pseudouridine synthase